MKKLGFLSILMFSLSLLAMANANADSGVILFVSQTGSMYPEAVEAGVSTVPETWPWGTNHNPYATVNIELEDPVGNLLYMDIRPIGQHNVEHFYGKIWTSDPELTFDIRAGYFVGANGGPWILPAKSATISFWQQNENYQTIINIPNNSWQWPQIISGLKGDWRFDIALYQTTVPEPGSLLALASGLVGLVGFKLRRRR